MKLIVKVWDFLEEACIIVLLTFMAGMNFLNVMSRYFFHRSFSFTEELVITCFVYVSMFGIAAAYKRGSHLGMGLITENVTPRIRSFMVLFSMLCSLALIGAIFYLSLDVIAGQMRSGEKTPVLGLPAYYQRVSIPLGCVLMAIRTGQWGFLAFRKDFFGAPAAPQGGN
ncbi:MAG: TRAP transporter small permease [Spirochaetaceae bacterium]|jgi:TRAP-type C4-dicarboxylate transport system permease small subunit|nr:TRAP transporter small permease [Spirochaetaceae bacterium]